MSLYPPYLSAAKSRLYGQKGNLHTSFDHERFASIIKATSHSYMVTYDDCPEVRELIDLANVMGWELQHGMNNYKQDRAAKGKELIITNYDLPGRGETSEIKLF